MLSFFTRHLKPKTTTQSTSAEKGKTDAELLILYRRFARKALFHKNVKVHMAKIEADIRGEEVGHG